MHFSRSTRTFSRISCFYCHCNVCLKHPDRSVRNLSACAIAEIASPEDEFLFQPLLTLLDERAVLVRIGAVKALVQLRNPQAILPLINLLQDPNSTIRYHAIRGLGQIGDIIIVEKLKQRKIQVTPDEAWLIDEAINKIETANS